jgi:hypothetical protein
LLEGRGEGGLPDPYLVLHDADGRQTVYGQTTAGAGSASLSFTPGQSGTYYVDLGAAGENDAGRYLLSIVGRQVDDFSGGGVYGEWSARNLFDGQGSGGAGVLANAGQASVMADTGQAAGGLSSEGKGQPGGVLAAGS